MNRKLYNTLPVLTASAALLVVGLLVVTPVSQPGAIEAAKSTPGIAALAVMANPMDGPTSNSTESESGSDTPHVKGTSGHYRQRFLAMPYFSFVPRG